MGSKKFTFIELHLDGDTQFGPRELGEGVFGEADEPDEIEEDDDEEESGGAGAIGAVVGLVVLVAVALALRKFRGDDDPEEFDVEDEPDVVIN